MILIITNKDDITVDFIISKLNKSNTKYYRFNTEELSTNNLGINLNIKNNKFEIIDYVKNITINLDSIYSVYYRRPKIYEDEKNHLSKGEKLFLINEMKYSLEGIYSFLKNKFWISPVDSIRIAENKVYQLLLAKKIGFKVPNSLISTNKNKAEIFINEANTEYIIKPVKSGYIDNKNNPKIIFTNLLKKSHITKLDRISKCPTYFQEKINKKYDIRTTIVGNKIFSAKILSQDYEETQIDWRKGENAKLKYEKIILPQKLEKMCLNLLKKLNLNFGAIDFVCNENNDIYFLEINPNGQWAWIERRLKFNISGEILKLLSRKL